MASVPSSKLRIPPPLPGTVPRARLEALLDQAPTEGLTLVTGPPGYGKTVLIAGWAHSRPHANTVKTHLRSIYTKLGVNGRRAAVLAAHEQGAIT